jgi:threonine-phosphate decarboxylase
MKITHGGNLFRVARERGWNWREVLDLSASINPLGPAPGVRDAILGAMDRITHYPDGARLEEALAAAWGVSPDEVMVGNGATELLHFLGRVWPQVIVTLITPAFSEFHRANPHANLCGWADMERWPSQGLVILTQPVNPTGQMVGFRALREWLGRTENPVLIDESFLDFCEEPSAMTLLRERKNLLVLRSLTKFYAMPGLRVGALVAESGFLKKLREKREPWQVNALAEAAAIASLEDAEYAAATRALVAEERAWMWRNLRKLPSITLLKPAANYCFFFMEGGSEDLCRWFLERKVILRDCRGWPGIEGDGARFAIGKREQNERIAGLLKEYLCGAA